MAYKEDEEDVNKEVGRARRVGVFDFGTGRVGYLQKSLGTRTGRNGSVTRNPVGPWTWGLPPCPLYRSVSILD